MIYDRKEDLFSHSNAQPKDIETIEDSIWNKIHKLKT